MTTGRQRGTACFAEATDGRRAVPGRTTRRLRAGARLGGWSQALMVHSYRMIEGCAIGQVLHGCATTTEAVRRAIQNSHESLRALAKRYYQPEDCREGEAARDRRRSLDSPQRSQVHCPLHQGGGDHRRLPAACAAATGRLPLCAAANHPSRI